MNINSCLDSASVKMTCEDYIDYMQSEMEAYEEIESRINTFLAEEESYSNSITNIKTQMEDYSLVLTTLRISNEEDISDAKTLMDLVGNETMDGRIIFREQNEASIEASDCRSKASSAKKNANGATQPGEYQDIKQRLRIGKEGHLLQIQDIIFIRKKNNFMMKLIQSHLRYL